MNCIECSANVRNYLTSNTKQHTFKLVNRLNGPMAFRSGQNYMNFANILKLYTEHIKSLDMKSNRANSSSNLKK